MRERRCEICQEDMWLRDSGFDKECNEFFRLYACEQGHESVDRFTRDELDEELDKEGRQRRYERLKRLLSKFEEEDASGGG